MTQSDRKVSRPILRSLLPVVTVLLASVTSAYLVYDNYLVDRGAAAQMAAFEPAAGGPAGGGPASISP